MSLIQFLCPACSKAIEAPSRVRQDGITCPACNVGFVPSDFMEVSSHKVTPPLASEFKLAPPDRRVKEHARSVSLVSFLCFALFGILLFFWLKWEWEASGPYGSKPPSKALLVAAGAFFQIGLVLTVIAQLLHIRAAGEKIDSCPLSPFPPFSLSPFPPFSFPAFMLTPRGGV